MVYEIYFINFISCIYMFVEFIENYYILWYCEIIFFKGI